MTLKKHKNLKAINIFCDASGMSYGLKQSGVNVLAGIDNAIECQTTYIEATPKSGGNLSAWKDVEELQSLTNKGQDKISSDVYGFMYWYRSTLIVTTQSNGFSNGRYQQPDESHVISIRERDTLQSFPKKYYFRGNSLHSFARQIVNAVPPELARKLGEHIKQIYQNG